MILEAAFVFFLIGSFRSTYLDVYDDNSVCANPMWLKVLHHHIASVEKLLLTASGCPLLIHCKTFQLLHLLFQKERDCQDVYQSLLRLSQPGKHRHNNTPVLCCNDMICFIYIFVTIVLAMDTIHTIV